MAGSSLRSSASAWLIAGVIYIPLALAPQRIPYIRYDLQSLLTYILIVLFSALLFVGRRSKLSLGQSAEDRPLQIFLLLLAASTIFSGGGYPEIEALSRWSVLILLFLISRSLFSDADSRTTFLRILVPLGLLIAAALLVGEYYPKSFINWRIVPFKMNDNYVAQILILPFAASLILAWRSSSIIFRLVAACAAVASATAIFVTDSRAVWLGLVAGAVLFAAERLLYRMSFKPPSARQVMIGGSVLVGLIVLVVVFVVPEFGTALDSKLDAIEGSAGGRIRRWLNALPMIGDHLLLGVGPGGWGANYLPYQHSVVTDVRGFPAPFNSWIELLAEAGLPCFLVFVAATLAIFIPAGEGSKEVSVLRASAVAGLVAALFHPTFSTEMLAGGLIVSLALVSAGRIPDAAPTRSLMLPALFLFCLCTLPLRWFGVGEKLVVLSSEISRSSSLGRSSPELQVGVEIFAGPLISDPKRPFDSVEALALFAGGRTENIFGTAADQIERSAGCDKALQIWNQAWQQLPGLPQNAEGYLRCLRVSGRVGEAAAVAKEAVVLHARQPDVVFAAAEAAEQGFDKEAALVRYRAAEAGYRQVLGGSLFGQAGKLQKRTLEGKLSKLRAAITGLEARIAPAPLSAALEQIADVPLINKGIALLGSTVYLSGNGLGWPALFQVVPDGTVTPVSTGPYAYFRLRASAAGNSIFFINDRFGSGQFDIYRLSLADGAIQPITHGLGNQNFGEYEPSPDGSKIAAIRETKSGLRVVITVDLLSGKTRAYLPGRGRKGSLAWSPSGAKLVFVESNQSINLVDLAQGTTRSIWTSTSEEITATTFSPDGTKVALISHDGSGAGRLLLLDPGSGSVSEPLANSGKLLDPLWISGTRILIRERLEDQYLLRLIDLEKRSIRPIGPDRGVVYSPEIYGEKALFLYAADSIPMQLNEIALDEAAHPVTVRANLGEVAPTAIVSAETVRFNAADRVFTAYLYRPPQTAALGAARSIIWLHGASDAFSPRWHSHAQFFSNAGINFIALNYLGECKRTSADCRYRRSLTGASETALAKLRSMIPDLLGPDAQPPALLGVSTGTDLARRAIARSPVSYSALIEYSPATPEKESVRSAVKRLTFWGENDRRRPKFTPASPDRQTVVFLGEGHDLRNRSNVRDRMNATVGFLGRLEPAPPPVAHNSPK